MARVQAGHESGSRRRTHRAAGVVLRESNAFPCEPVEGRRVETRLPVRAQVAISQIVCLNQENIRWRTRLIRHCETLMTPLACRDDYKQGHSRGSWHRALRQSRANVTIERFS